MRTVGFIELIEGIEDEDDMLLRRSLGEQLLEVRDEFLDVERQGFGAGRVCGSGVTDPGYRLRQFVAETAQRAAEIGGAGAGADESRKDEG